MGEGRRERGWGEGGIRYALINYKHAHCTCRIPNREILLNIFGREENYPAN